MLRTRLVAAIALWFAIVATIIAPASVRHAGGVSTCAASPGDAPRVPDGRCASHVGCTAVRGDPHDTVLQSLARAAAYLAGQQSDDGGWRSATYGSFHAGLALCGPAMKVLLAVEGHGAGMTMHCGRGLDALRDAAEDALRDPDDATRARAVIDYPVYTASMAILVLTRHARDGRDLAARDRWVVFLREAQLVERLGWSVEDLDYGGWGYATIPPRRPSQPAPGGAVADLPFTSDLSSTTFAVGALRIAGAGAGDPAIVAARRFVERCQDAASDGGFCTSPSRSIQNKAGALDPGDPAPMRFRSYGSATADGIRALLRCGARADAPRVVAATRWLRTRWTISTNPGAFAAERRDEQDGGFFYFAWSAAHAFRALEAAPGFDDLDPFHREWMRDAGESLVLHLLSLQGADGSWSNPNPFMREDDPLVATPLAAAAIALPAATRAASRSTRGRTALEIRRVAFRTAMMRPRPGARAPT